MRSLRIVMIVTTLLWGLSTEIPALAFDDDAPNTVPVADTIDMAAALPIPDTEFVLPKPCEIDTLPETVQAAVGSGPSAN